jgi:hypothetical protein
MAKEISLGQDELAALTAVDGTHAGSRMRAAIKARLTELRLVERLQWPNGPLWRASAGNRLVRGGKTKLKTGSRPRMKESESRP